MKRQSQEIGADAPISCSTPRRETQYVPLGPKAGDLRFTWNPVRSTLRRAADASPIAGRRRVSRDLYRCRRCAPDTRGMSHRLRRVDRVCDAGRPGKVANRPPRSFASKRGNALTDACPHSGTPSRAPPWRTLPQRRDGPSRAGGDAARFVSPDMGRSFRRDRAPCGYGSRADCGSAEPTNRRPGQ